MAKLSWKQAFINAVDAYRNAKGITDKIAVGSFPALLEEAIGSGGGGSGGGSLESCEVTVNQVWGMNDDPLFSYVHVLYYNVFSDGSVEPKYVVLASDVDFSPQHSVTFTAYKNIPIVIGVGGFSGYVKGEATSVGGTLKSPLDIGNSHFYQFVPTSDVASVTVTSP